MSSFTDLLQLPEGQLDGALFTAQEIAQQPHLWERVLDVLAERAADICAFLETAGMRGPEDPTVLLCGAGSSDYIGRSIAPVMRQSLHREVIPVATTSIVTNPGSVFIRGKSYAVLHFARSGDSPESVAAFRFLKSERPDVRHLVITCNSVGALARETAGDPKAFLLSLPPEANDRSLAMTSSFTSMALCGIGVSQLPYLDALRSSMIAVRRAVEDILEKHADIISGFAQAGFSKVCYLGSNVLQGVMDEGALKMLEMTAGAVSTMSNSFLGIRHGPLVFIDSQCAVVACLASGARSRRYELDLIEELRGRSPRTRILAVSACEDQSARRLVDQLIVLERDGTGMPDHMRVLVDIVVCQLLAFFASRSRGLSPDSPSRSGIISRVVQGVRIYPNA